MATVALGTVIRELIRGFYPQGSNPKAFPAIAQGFLELGPLRELETCAAEAETILRGISDELSPAATSPPTSTNISKPWSASMPRARPCC